MECTRWEQSCSPYRCFLVARAARITARRSSLLRVLFRRCPVALLLVTLDGWESWSIPVASCAERLQAATPSTRVAIVVFPRFRIGPILMLILSAVLVTLVQELVRNRARPTLTFLLARRIDQNPGNCRAYSGNAVFASSGRPEQ